MKAILNLYAKAQEWCDDFFPNRSLCSLPVAGKPLAEYLIDVCSEEGMTDVLVLDYSYNVEFNNALKDGHRWQLEVHYEGSSLVTDISRLLSKTSAFSGEDDLLIYWGAIMPKHTTLEELQAKMEPVTASGSLPDGVYYYSKGELKRCMIDVKSINSVKEYFDLNFEMLEHPDGYVLPGYSAENGVYLGMNVAIMQNVDIGAPVMLCDNICLERDCRLSGRVIVGNEALVDHGTVLRNAIVLDHTFVGHDVELDGKIVDSQRIIDPFEEVYMDQDDMGIASDMRQYSMKDWKDCLEYCIAALLAVVYLIPYLICWPLRKKFGEKLWAYKLSLDRYPKCWQVLLGQGCLIKHSGDEETPFVFRASDIFSLAHTEEQQKLDDVYYQHHRSVGMIIRVVYKGLLNRLIMRADERPNP